MRDRANELADRLDSIGRNVPEFYEPVVSDLHQVRMRARAFEVTVGELGLCSVTTSSQDEPEDTTTIEVSTQALCDALQQACNIVSDPRTQSLLTKMQSECNQLSRFSKELNSLSFLMLVTTAHCIVGGFSVAHLVSELRDMATSLSEAGKKINETLSQVELVRNETAVSLQKALNLILEAHFIEAGMRDDGAQQISPTSNADVPRRMSQKLSKDLAQLMPEIVACMQYPDAFSQRCDHMAMALRMTGEDDLSQACETKLRNLVSAQLRDIVGELNSVQGNALATLDEISSHSRRTLTEFNNYLEKDENLKQISAQQKSIESTSDSLQHINEVAGSALSNLVACVEYFNGVEKSFKQLNEMREAVRMSSLNADLSERQSESNMPELRSVTKAVADCAGSCGVTIKNLGIQYKELKNVFGSINQEQVSGAISAVEGCLDCSRKELECLASQVQGIREHTRECAETLSQIDDLGQSAHARIASNTMASKQLEQIDQQICSGLETAPLDAFHADSENLQRVFDSYSIEREREVHYSVLPAGTEATHNQKDINEASDDDDPLAEFLF